MSLFNVEVLKSKYKELSDDDLKEQLMFEVFKMNQLETDGSSKMFYKAAALILKVAVMAEIVERKAEEENND